jgi:DNA-binding MarR family transcriptional regulator
MTRKAPQIRQDISALGFDIDAVGEFPHRNLPPYLALVLARMLQNDYMARIAGTGIAPAQAFILGELWSSEPLSQIELARRLDLGKATIGQTLNRLEKSGLIKRRRCKDDGRAIKIHLTERGRNLRPSLETASLEQLEALTRRLGPRDMRRLTNVLVRAVSALRASIPPVP